MTKLQPVSDHSNWWTTDRVEELKKRWRDNESSSEIAIALHSTRNAILGKVWRLGLLKPLGIKHPKRPTPQRALKTVVRPVNHGGYFKIKKQVDAVIEETPTVFANPKRFVELNGNECHWPGNGEPGPDLLFCAAPVVNGKPYCLGHCRLAYAGHGSRL